MEITTRVYNPEDSVISGCIFVSHEPDVAEIPILTILVALLPKFKGLRYSVRRTTHLFLTCSYKYLRLDTAKVER